MEEDVTLARVLQRRRECLDELGREVADEADRVGEEYLTPDALVLRVHPRHVRPERREEFVFARDPLSGECIHEARLARIGVADDPDRYEPLAGARLAVLGTHADIGLETLLYSPLFLAEVTLHDLGIGLADTARPHTAALTGELHPHAIDTRTHVPDGGELDLELGLGRVGVEGEYLEDEVHAVPYLHLGLRLAEGLGDVVYLEGFHDIADDEEIGVEEGPLLDDLGELTTPDEGAIVDRIAPLDVVHDRDARVRMHETLQLLHTGLEVLGREGLWDDIDEDGTHGKGERIRVWYPFWGRSQYETIGSILRIRRGLVPEYPRSG